jgi:hypothetical protein
MRERSFPPPHLRQEIFALGGRHLGDALGGARRELQNAALPAERRKLLEAVVRHLEHDTEFAKGTPTSPTEQAQSGVSLRQLLLVAVFVASLVWALSLLLKSLSA